MEATENILPSIETLLKETLNRYKKEALQLGEKIAEIEDLLDYQAKKKTLKLAPELPLKPAPKIFVSTDKFTPNEDTHIGKILVILALAKKCLSVGEIGDQYRMKFPDSDTNNRALSAILSQNKGKRVGAYPFEGITYYGNLSWFENEEIKPEYRHNK
jgi:hypothetical protein